MAKKVNLKDFAIGKTVIAKRSEGVYKEGVISGMAIKKMYTADDLKGTVVSYELHVADTTGTVVFSGKTLEEAVVNMYPKN